MQEERYSLLIADADRPWSRRVGYQLDQEAFEVLYAETLKEARETLERHPVTFVLLGLDDPRWIQTTQLQEIIAAAPQTRFLALLGPGTEGSEQVLRHVGFREFLLHDIPLAHLVQTMGRYRDLRRLEEQNDRFKQLLECRTCFESLLGGSAPMRALYRLIEQVSRADAPVLVTGEPGSEFSAVVHSIHQRSSRCIHPLVIVDAAEANEERQEMEIFGPAGRGSYANGPSSSGSAFARAGQGVLVLQSIEKLGSASQSRLLSFLHAPFFQGETSSSAQPVARIIVTASGDLQRMAAEGSFNRELYYRLSILQIRIPPLRERREDIPMLAEHLLQEMPGIGGPAGSARKGRQTPAFSNEAMLAMFQHSWPGNMEEMRSAVAAAVQCAKGLQIELEDLAASVGRPAVPADRPASATATNVPLRLARRTFEADYFRGLLERTGGNMTMASRISKVGRPYLYKKLKEHAIDPESFRKAA